VLALKKFVTSIPGVRPVTSLQGRLSGASTGNPVNVGGLNDVTQILEAAERGDPKAAEELLPLIYEELRKLASAKMANEAPGHTLQPTALVHEAWLRLVGEQNPKFANPAHFFSAAAEARRRILIDRARRKRAVRQRGSRKAGHPGNRIRRPRHQVPLTQPATSGKSGFEPVSCPAMLNAGARWLRIHTARLGGIATTPPICGSFSRDRTAPAVAFLRSMVATATALGLCSSEMARCQAVSLASNRPL